MEEKTVDAGCKVDWSWLEGRTIKHMTSDLQTVLIEFEDGQTLKVQALNYKSEPFLSFTPYKDPRS